MPYLGLYTADIKAVAADLAAIPKSQFTCSTLATVQAIQADHATLLNAAPASVNSGGSFGSVAAADKALHDAQLDIISKVQGNTELAALAVSGSHTGFQGVPQRLATGVTVNSAPHANLAEIGQIFNSAADLAIGGLNASNLIYQYGFDRGLHRPQAADRQRSGVVRG